MDDSNYYIDQILLRELNTDEILRIIPELGDIIGCRQNHPGHEFDVFTHTIKVVDQLPLDLTLRLAGLLHDIGKPEKKVLGNDGYNHFWGHEEVGAQKAKLILERLNITEQQVETILQLIRLHDTPIAKNLSEMRAAINQYGRSFICDLLTLQRADLNAHSTNYIIRKMPTWEEMYNLYKMVIADFE